MCQFISEKNKFEILAWLLNKFSIYLVDIGLKLNFYLSIALEWDADKDKFDYDNCWLDAFDTALYI